MLLWPLGLTAVVTWLVFHDPAFDHRLAMGGALVPIAIDLPARHTAIGHTLFLAVLVLTVVMLATRRRRRWRRHAIALPIGMLLGLVAAATWTRPHVLWWPAFGAHFPRESLVAPLPIALLEELAGAVAIVWFVVRFELREPVHRSVWIRTGRLSAVRDEPS